jgi:hypothetical protein
MTDSRDDMPGAPADTNGRTRRLPGTPIRGRRQLSVGDTFPVQLLDRLETLSGDAARLPDPGHLVHVQMRRFAGCPICNLHLRSVITRMSEITGAGVSEVVVFHSTIQELRQYESDLPFTVLADPRKELYRALGVESSPLAVLNPSFWPRVPAVMAQLAHTVRRSRRGAPIAPTGGQLGLPADFLLDPTGKSWPSNTASTQATSGRSPSCSNTPPPPEAPTPLPRPDAVLACLVPAWRRKPRSSSPGRPSEASSTPLLARKSSRPRYGTVGSPLVTASTPAAASGSRPGGLDPHPFADHHWMSQHHGNSRSIRFLPGSDAGRPRGAMTDGLSPQGIPAKDPTTGPPQTSQ